MRPTDNRGREASIILLALLALSFLTLAISIKPAQAFAASVKNTAASFSTTSQAPTLSLTVNAATDIIVFSWNSQTHQTGSYPSIGASVSDSCGDTYQNIGTSQATFFSSPNYFIMTEGMVSTSALCSGAVTITLTLTGLAPTGSGFSAVDISGASGASPLTRSVGSSCNNNCASPQLLLTPMNFSAGGVTVVFGEGFNAGTETPTSASYSSLTGSGNTFMMYSTTISSPDSGSITTTVAAGTFWMVGATWGTTSATTVSSTTINTGCLGACSGGNNGTSTYFSVSMPNLFIFQQSQNVASAAIIDNFTMKVKAVHVTTNTATLYVITCEPQTPTSAASGTNLWSCFNPYTVSVANNTANGFIHANPQTLLCSSCYYAVGIMAASTASRGSGAVGSGVSFYETSQLGINQYSYNVGSTTPPTTFFSNTASTPIFFMYVHSSFTVATATTTTTSTLTGSFTSTVTTTTTSTATTIDSTFFTQNANFPFMVLILMLPAGLFLGITRNLSGGIVGLLIGGAIGAFTGVIPSWIFTGIVISVVAMAFLITRSDRNG